MADKKRLIAYDPITFESFIRHATKHIDPYYDPYGEGFTDAVDNIEGWLKNNTVDAVEEVHGEWTLVIDENDCECIECPLCGEQFYDGDNDTFDKPYNYCPNCGARMDGDGEEE